MVKKIKVLFMSDYGDTGFGTVGKNLMARLADMDIFECHWLGWHATPNDVPVAARMKINLHTTQFWNAADQFGKDTFNTLVDAIQPDVVLTLGDPWMTDHVAFSPRRDRYTWLCYVPIDRDVISLPWIGSLKKPDCIVTFSQFGYDVVNSQIPLKTQRLILHGVDRMVFKPWYPPGTDENTDVDELMRMRKQISMGQLSDKFIVGFVGRNQVRKDIPRAAVSFKAFNCKTWIDKEEIEIKDGEGEVVESIPAQEFCRNKQCFRCDVCPAFKQRKETENTIMYLHTTRGDGKDIHDRPGIGWRIDELFYRLGLQGRVAMTPNYTALKGLPHAAVAQIMNCFDVHLFLSHSEGFGLPIAESLACGVPTLATNYSSMTELVSGGGGVAINVREYDTFVTWENTWALADIAHASEELNKLFMDKEYRAKMRKEAAANDYVPTWDVVAAQFRDLILESQGVKA